jgi:carbon-monoxide dehydrogenase medium subunit
VGELFVASTLASAVERLAGDPGARPIAGGVGVMLARALGLPGVERWVGIGALPELRQRALQIPTGALILGAGLTVEALTDRDASPPAPRLLAAAARDVANPGIRVVATIGGNVVASGSASDLVAAFVALATDAEVITATGTHHIPVEDLCGTGRLEGGALIRAFHIPAGMLRWGWQRLSIRGAMDRSSASVAVTAGARGVRIAATCVSDRPIRFPAAEHALATALHAGLAGDTLARVRAAVALDVASADLLDDDRVSGAYRRRVLPALVERAARQALART